MVLFVNLTFALSFPFHELHVRSIQIYERLIMHVQAEQDFKYPVDRTTKSFFKYKTSKQITFCLQNSVIVTSRKSRSLHATYNCNNFLPTPDSISSSSRQNFVPLVRNLLTHISTYPAATRVLSRSNRENPGNEVGAQQNSLTSQPCLHTIMQTRLSANQCARTMLVI